MNEPTPEQLAWQQLRPFLRLSYLAQQLHLTRNAALTWKEVPEKYVDRVAQITGLPVSALRPSRVPAGTGKLWDVYR